MQISLLRAQSGQFEPTKPAEARLHQPCFIEKLPNEVLLEIFAFSSPQIHSFTPLGFPTFPDFPKHSLDTNSPPWSLTVVCWRWHLLVTTYPALWSTIISPSSPSPWQIKRALLQIARSEQHPLSIHLGLLGADGGDLLEALLKQSHRWKFAHLPHWHHCSDPSASPYTPFPLLEGLSYRPYMFSKHLPPLQHQHFPRLKSIYSHKAPTDFDLWSPDRALVSHLTHLTFFGHPYQKILPLLQTCAPYLESLQVFVTNSDTSTTFVQFPKLRRLNVVFDAPYHHRLTRDNVLETFECPRLEELEACTYYFSCLNLPSPPPVATLVSLSVSWSPDDDDLLHFLASTRGLKFLQVQVSNRTKDLQFSYGVEKLCILLSDPDLLPHLADVSIKDVKPHPRTVQQIIGFFQLVRHRGATLQRASFSLINFYWPVPATSRYRLTIENDLIRGELKKITAELRLEYPYLALQISCLYGTTVYSEVDRRKYYVTDTEMW